MLEMVSYFHLSMAETTQGVLFSSPMEFLLEFSLGTIQKNEFWGAVKQGVTKRTKNPLKPTRCTLNNEDGKEGEDAGAGKDSEIV